MLSWVASQVVRNDIESSRVGIRVIAVSAPDSWFTVLNPQELLRNDDSIISSADAKLALILYKSLMEEEPHHGGFLEPHLTVVTRTTTASTSIQVRTETCVVSNFIRIP
jgi:hypothetical protein